MRTLMGMTFPISVHSYFTQRFDHVDGGKRIHVASAMTLLGYTDGFNYQNGGSYLEIVAEYSRWKKDEAEGSIQQYINHISTWLIIAQRLGISAAEQRVMRSAFDRYLQS